MPALRCDVLVDDPHDNDDETEDPEQVFIAARLVGDDGDRGGELIQREDDRPESIVVRMEAYERSTMPLIRFYSDLGLLMRVPATGSPSDICARSLAAFETSV